MGKYSRTGRVILGALAATALSIGMTGCATPLVSPNPLAMQVKADHAVNWQQLAQRAVLKLPTTINSQRPSVYVDPGPAATPFAMAYTRFLEQSLYDHGYPVMKTRAGAEMVIESRAQWLLYGRGHQKPIGDYATLWTTAAAVGAQFRTISSVDTGFGVGLVVGPVLDFLKAMNGTTNAEVVLSTTVQDGGHYHYLGSETYYVMPSDLAFYIAPPEPLNLPVVPLRISEGFR